MKIKSLFAISILASTSILLIASCSNSASSSMMRNQSANSSAPISMEKSRSSSTNEVNESEAFASTKKDRPGLATTWGKSVKSPLGSMNFTRASTMPVGVDAIFYNNNEGLEAMGGKEMKVAPMQQAARGIIEWGIKGNMGMLSSYKSYTGNGYRRFTQGSNDGTYSIVIKNRCKSRVQVVLSVDGLSVVNSKPTNSQGAGYVIDPEKVLEVK
jgi:hypothetical protein